MIEFVDFALIKHPELQRWLSIISNNFLILRNIILHIIAINIKHLLYACSCRKITKVHLQHS